MKRKTEHQVSKLPLAIGVMAMALAAGIGVSIMRSPGQTVAQQESKPAAPLQKPGDVKIYTPHYNKGELHLEPSIAKPAANQDPRVYAVNQYLSGLSIVPKSARAMTCQISGNTATLDFSPEFDKTYGTEDEQTILKGLLTVMSQFDGVKKVKFTVQGRTLDSLGNVDLTEPQPVIPESAPSAPTKSDAQIQ